MTDATRTCSCRDTDTPPARLVRMIFAALLAVALTAFPANGQSLNIDFGTEAGVPIPAWPGEGRAGIWNAVQPPSFDDAPGPSAPIPLLDLDGGAVVATLRVIPTAAPAHADDPATTGDTERLLDDYLPCSASEPVTLLLENLVNDFYDVVVYGWLPGNGAATSIAVASGDATIGGPWPGALTLGVTHMVATVEVTNGRIEITIDGAAVNGVQIVRDEPPGPADADIDQDGNIGMTDLVILLGAWNKGHGCDGIQPGAVCPGDIDHDGNVGFTDLTILLEFWGADV